ncbi:reverse transcriptase domain-containing protein [Tanacetum coccineum]
MPKYAKFMKDLLIKKEKFEETSKVTLNERCSAILLKEIPLKEKDPGSFTIPCDIGKVGIDKALADLGVSITLMPYLMFVRLKLGELKPTHMCIELANKSTQYPRGIAENVIIKINKFVFPVDFVVLDMEEDFKEDESKIAMDEEKLRNSFDSLTTSGLFSDLDDLEPDDFKNPTLFATRTIDEEKQILKLKELPSHLEYAFLNGHQEFPIIISSLLSHQEKVLLLQVLSKHKAALAWKVADIKGAVLKQRIDKKFRSIYYASKTMNDTQEHYTTTEKELLVVVYAFDKFRSYLVISKTVVYTDHSVLKYLFSKQDANPRLIRLENPKLEELEEEEIRDSFLDEHLMAIYVKEPEKDPWYADYAKFLVSKGIDFMGPFHFSQNNKYILVAVDYVTKWMEVEALPTNEARVVVKFLRRLFSRFGVPKVLIIHKGIHFCNSLHVKTLKNYRLTHRLATAYHPQISGQTENTNRAIKRILERTANGNKNEWADKLNDALWAFKTAYMSPIGITPFRIVYGKACHLPIKMEHKAYWALKNVNLDLDAAGRNRLKLFPGKLKIRWYGPYTVIKVFPYGTVEVYGKDGIHFKVATAKKWMIEITPACG